MNSRRHFFLVASAVCGMMAGLLLANRLRNAGTPTSTASPSPVRAFLEKHQLLGHVVLLQFGDIGCELSDAGLEAMILWHGQDEIEGLRYVRVEQSSDAARVAEYYTARKPIIPVVHDADASAARAFQATAIPTYVLADRFGRVRYRGALPSEHIKDWAAVLRAEKKDGGPDAIAFGVPDLDIPKLLTETSLPGLDGTPPMALDKFLGKGGLMIVFVDTECPFAGGILEEVPDIAPLLAALKIPTVLINIKDDKEKIDEYYKNRKVGAPVVYDQGKATHLKWGVYSVPRIFLVNSERRLIYGGVAVWSNVFAAVTQELSIREKPLTAPHSGTEYG